MVELSANFQVGQPSGDVDCFFDSVAQGLKQLKPELNFTVKSLRLVCKSFAQSQLESDNKLWLKKALKENNQKINQYIFCIEITAYDIQQQKSQVVRFSRLPIPIWGRSEIEGRIICAEYNVKLHVVKKLIVEGKEVWTHQIVDGEQSQFVDAIDYNNEENTIHLVNTAHLHFEPLLKTQAVQYNEQQQPSYPSDPDEEDVEMTAEEELFYIVRSKNSEATKIKKIRKLFASAPNLDVNFKGKNNDTCLHIVVRKNELKVVELLVKKGARMDLKNDKNKSPLNVAERLKRQDMQEVLVEGQKTRNQENDDERRKQSKQKKSVSRSTYDGLPPKQRVKLQKVNQTANGKYNKLAYEKRSGTAGMHGQLYETELLMLFLLQAEAKKDIISINSFYLATNMQEAGDFDDVVFKYKYSENGVEKSNIIFLQAKHKEAEKGKRFTIDTLLSPSEKGDFLLRKYLSSYLKIKQLQFNGIHPLFQDGVDKSDFVIYTNSAWNFDKSSDCVKKKKIKPENILHFAENPEMNYYKLNANETVKSALRHSLDFEILVRELAQSVYSGSIESSKLIFNDYHVSLAHRVIQISDTNKKDSKLSHSFLYGANDAEFSRAFLKEIKDNKNFSKTFSAKSDNELKKELRKKIIKLPENFGRDEDNDLKLSLPNKTIPDESIEEFLNELKLFINQPNVNDLEETIKNIITETFKIEETDDANLIYCDVHSKLTKWWRERGNVEYITEHNRLFNKAKENLSNMNLVGLAVLYAKRIKSLGFNFKRDQIKRLSRLISEKRILNIISCGDAVILSTAKVYQALDGLSEYKSEEDNDKYIFLSLTSVLELQNQVISAFKSERRDLLVIECEGTETNFGKLYDQLVDTVKQYNCKKIVLITRENDPLARLFKRDFSEDSQYEEEIDGSNTLADLDIESQITVGEKQIIFQGIETELGTLIDEKSKHLIGADILSKLINNEKIKVDKTPGDLDEEKYYHIDRTFHRRVSIKKECFKETNIQDIFVVSNVKGNEFSLLAGGGRVRNLKDIGSNQRITSRFIMLDDDDDVHEKLKELYTKYQTYNIHWMKKEGDTFVWQQSHGSLSDLREFVDTEDIKEYPAETITSIPDKIVILSAEPGMGKSVLLTKIAEKEKKTNPSLWILKIKLTDCTKQLNEMHFNKNNLNETINFLSEIMSLKSPLEKTLFKHRVENQGKIAFLFDGFDEISPQYKDKFIALVEILKETMIDKLWITTRPHMRDELEEEFKVFSYSLKPLSGEDQKHFLKRFWGRKLGLKNDTDNNRLNTYIEKLLHIWWLSIGDLERSFTGIPLQTRMLAEVYQDEFEEFFKSEQSVPIFPSKLNLLNLYQSFIDKKYDIYWLEKNRVDKTIPSMNKVFEEYRSKFMLNHQLLALQVVFSDREVNSLLSVKEKTLLRGFTEEILKGSENTGIIICDFNGTLDFIHRTIAEFFAAFWLADKRESQEAKNILQYKLFETENRVLRNFFDRILVTDKNNRNRYEIHTAVLNYDIKKVKELSSGLQSREFDRGGRTALHLAAAYGFTDIAEILLNNDTTCIGVEDIIFDWRPLRYADMGSHWHVAELLLQRGAKSDDMLKSISRTNSIKAYRETLLCSVAKNGHLKLTELLLQNNSNIHGQYLYKMTPLHYAATGGNLEVVKLLIQKGFDMNLQNSNGDTVLHCAAKKGNLEVIKYLIEKGVFFNTQNTNGHTVLHSAAEKDYWDVVTIFIENGVDINVQNNFGDTVLHYAAKKGNLDAVKFLIDKGAYINCKNNNGDTVLHCAAKKGDVDVAKILIDKGADINRENSDSYTALYCAAKKGNWDVVKLLIAIGADFNYKINNGCTVLHQAAFSGNLEVMKLLREKGAYINTTNNNGDSVLHYAAKKGNMDAVTFLVEEGADLTCQNSDGHTVLHSAAEKSNWDVVKFFIQKGVDLNFQNYYGDTVLHYAASEGNWKAVQFLIEQGANLNCQNKNGNTVLHYVATKGHWSKIKFLIEKGADFNRQNNNGDTILHYAARKGKLDIVKLLIEKEADFNCQNNHGNSALHYAAVNGHLQVVRFLMKKGVNINCQNSDGDTILHFAAFGGNLDVVKLLIDSGANLNAKNINGKTVLNSAALGGNLDVVKFLINQGLDINCANSNGDTALHSACFENNWDVCKFLAEQGANVNCQNNDNETVLHYATKMGKWDIIKFLTEKGADVNCQNNDGNTALHYATKMGKWDVIELLIEKGADLNCQNNDGNTVLHSASLENNWDVLKFLTEQGANLNTQNNDGDTVLHDATKMDQWDVIKFLIEKGANYHTQNSYGDIVLHYAAYRGNLDAVKFLLEKGTDINHQNAEGDTVLHSAAEKGNLNVVKYLVMRGADFNCQNNNGDTILHFAALGGNLDLVEFLVEKGADFHRLNNYGDSVLHYAALKGNTDIVKFLLEKNAHITCQNEDGDTVLHFAAFIGKVDLVKLLLDKGMDLNIQNYYGDTVLYPATKKGHFRVVKLLIRKGADYYHENNNGDTVLHYAAFKGSFKVVKFLIKKGIDFNIENDDGDSILHAAAYGGNLDVVKFLIHKGADLNWRNKNGDTVLHYAALKSSMDAVKFLVEKNAYINCQNKNGDTVLHYAVFNGNKDVAKFLVEKNAVFQCQNKNGDTVLHYVAKKGDLDMVKFLIEKGANFNTENGNGNTVLHDAVKMGKWNVVKFLIEKGANVNFKNFNGDTVLHYAASWGNFDVVKSIIEKGADFNGKNYYSNTVLHSAAYGGNLDLVKFLIEKEVDLNCKNIEGDTALHYAASKGSVDVVKFLIEKGAYSHRVNNNGDSALHHAAFKGNLGVVELLIEKGVDINCRNSNDETALHSAALGNNLDVVKFLIDKGADFNCERYYGDTALHSAACKGNLDVVKFLIEKIYLNSVNEIGNTTVHSAAFAGNWDVVKFLIEEGADFNIENDDGDTILHDAAKVGMWDVVRFLVEKGADLNFQNYFGDTVLHYAAYWGNLDEIKFLIENGADFNLTNIDGDSVLHSAAEKGNLEVVGFLIEQGADLKCQNGKGNTVLHSAAIGGNSDVVKFLVEKGMDVNTENFSRESVLLSVVSRGNLDLAMFLVENGAELDWEKKKDKIGLLNAHNLMKSIQELLRCFVMSFCVNSCLNKK